MGNCNSTICKSSDHSVEADPDVAGIGVLVAFAASAVLALMAIAVGYLTDSMPENTLTDLDKYLVLAPLHTRYLKLRHAVSKILGVKKKANRVTFHVDYSTARTRRQESLERFLLALSDQQLVTGLAVLIAGYSKMCSMSIYHFNIVGSLAWFSSVTHLATLGVLRNYFVTHSALRNWRVFAMVLLLVMLLVARLPEWTSQDNSVPIFCFFQGVGIQHDFFNVMRLLTTIGFLVASYVQRIARLYSLDVDWNIAESLIEFVVKLWLQKGYREPLRQEVARNGTLSGHSTTGVSSAIRAERERGRYERYKLYITKSHGRFNSYFIAAIFIMGEYSYSFMNQMIILSFGLAYGFTYTIRFRSETPHGGITGNQNEMSFGQLVPLFLLLLPILAVLEIYFEIQKDSDSAHGNMPLEDSPPSMSVSSPLPSSEVNVHSNDIPMSDIDERPHPDISDGENLGSGTRGSIRVQSHEGIETHPTALEKLLKSLNSAILPLLMPDQSSPDEDGNEGLGTPHRVDTGFALRRYQNYQAERSEVASDNPQAAADTINNELSAAGDDRSTESNATTAVSPSSAQILISQSSRQPRAASNTQTNTRKAPFYLYSGIHYRRIIVCISVFILGVQTLFVLGLRGIFGAIDHFWVFLFSFTLLAILTIIMADRVLRRSWEIKRATTEAS